MIRRPPRSILFPTRRSSDLLSANPLKVERMRALGATVELRGADFDEAKEAAKDRKSTRLNSSHVRISYAVFCLKKKKKKKNTKERKKQISNSNNEVQN